jgi:hypothetical protein
LFVVVLAAAASLHAQSNTAPPALGLPRLESTAKANDHVLLVADKLAIDDLCATGVAGGNTVASFAPPSSAAQANAPASAQPLATQKPSSELKRTFEALNHNPIEFYGRALDQHGEPVNGAEVTGSVLYNTGVKSGRKVASTITDAGGYFRFSGLEGQTLGIDFKKSGYEFNPRHTLFSFSYFEADHKRHIPDPKNPVIFTLWKKQGAEALVYYDKTFWEIPADGTPLKLNLATGRMGDAEADMIVSLARTPLRMRYGERGYAWNATVEIVGGGMIRVGEQDYYNLAPESGYLPRFEHAQESQSVRDAQSEKIKWTWRGEVEDTFLVKSLDGRRYARVHLRISSSCRQTNDANASMSVTVWLNPSGSRNLEFDSRKAIAPPR